jgi:hypothetical protein
MDRNSVPSTVKCRSVTVGKRVRSLNHSTRNLHQLQARTEVYLLIGQIWRFFRHVESVNWPRKYRW